MLDLSAINIFVTVPGYLTLDNATINMLAGGRIDFTGTASTLGGSGTVLFADGDTRTTLWVRTSAAKLTIGPGVTVTGNSGTIGYSRNCSI